MSTASETLFEVRPTALPGCVELLPRRIDDERGRFVKTFHRDSWLALGLATDFAEEYYSVSQRGVIRGLHFQTPPHQHAKVVHCVHGRVQDAILDLRAGSPTYGRHAVLELSAETANLLYIPAGFAHGFCTLSNSAIVVYKAETQHSPENDMGILWNSAGIPWKATRPILSPRDCAHPTLENFITPFSYPGHANRFPPID